MSKSSGDGNSDGLNSDKIEDLVNEFLGASSNGDNNDIEDVEGILPDSVDISRRNVMKGLSALGATGILGGTAMNYVGESTANQPSIPDSRKKNWGLMRKARQDHTWKDVYGHVVNQFAHNSASLNLLDISWEETGNPDPSGNNENGSWKLTFRLSNFGLWVPDMNVENPKLERYSSGDIEDPIHKSHIGLVDEYIVKTPIAQDPNKHDGDVISVSPRGDSEMLGLVNAHKLQEELTKEDSNVIKEDFLDILEELQDVDSRKVINIPEIKAKMKEKGMVGKVILGIVVLFIIIFASLFAAAAAAGSAAIATFLGALGASIGGITLLKSIADFFKIDQGIPFNKGFKIKRPH